MSCPFHQTQFVDHEVFKFERFVTIGLPVKDAYDHFHCKQCYTQTSNQEWVIIGIEYYHYEHGQWHYIHRMPEHPRKGKYIGTKVYQP